MIINFDKGNFFGLDEKFKTPQCFQVQLKNGTDQFRDVEKMNKCSSNKKDGLETILAKVENLNYTVKCNGITREDCEKSCRGVNGLLFGNVDTEVFCTKLKVSTAKRSNLSLVGREDDLHRD